MYGYERHVHGCNLLDSLLLCKTLLESGGPRLLRKGEPKQHLHVRDHAGGHRHAVRDGHVMEEQPRGPVCYITVLNTPFKALRPESQA